MYLAASRTCLKPPSLLTRRRDRSIKTACYLIEVSVKKGSMGDEADVTGSTQGSSDPRGRARLFLPSECWDQPYGWPSSPLRSRARESCEFGLGQLEINKGIEPDRL